MIWQLGLVVIVKLSKKTSIVICYQNHKFYLRTVYLKWQMVGIAVIEELEIMVKTSFTTKVQGGVFIRMCCLIIKNLIQIIKLILLRWSYITMIFWYYLVQVGCGWPFKFYLWCIRYNQLTWIYLFLFI